MAAQIIIKASSKVFIKVVSATLLLVFCQLLSLKESTNETRKNIFLFHLKRSFRS